MGAGTVQVVGRTSDDATPVGTGSRASGVGQWTSPTGEVRRRRSRRDWVVDSLVFVLAVLGGLLMLVIASTPVEDAGVVPFTPLTATADVALGALACLSLWWRRRYPVTLTLLTTAVSVVSTSSVFAVMALVFTVALHRRWVWTVPVIAAQVVASLAYWLAWTDGSLGWLVGLTFVFAGVAMLAAVVALGMFVRARRQLMASLRERAERAEAEQARSAQAARLGERTRIAREMHDVLAHRISLVSMHAGALEFRPDAEPDEVAVAAGIIRHNAHLALEDLREVIGVLRSDPALPDATDTDSGSRPQPSLDALEALLAETRGTGATVQSEVDLPEDGTADLPLTTSRTAYRVLQEGLTNARKHGRGGVVRVRVAGRPGEGVSVEVSNALRPAHGAPGSGTVPTGQVPGAGRGLVGLAERTMLAGGRMEHGVEGDAFMLRVWLPWG
ncbi:sensor histidine kinase [Aquipuribacter sp. MA13-6]|uniref:sensor histidine kinase n=1 Tax=unclassified Aquipuribacter TaxID=2635084 RepID=UPI003EED33F6